MSNSKTGVDSIADAGRALSQMYRAALIRGGVPAVYADLAQQSFDGQLSEKSIKSRSVTGLIYAGFVWAKTPQGLEFWSAIAQEASREAA